MKHHSLSAIWGDQLDLGVGLPEATADEGTAGIAAIADADIVAVD